MATPKIIADFETQISSAISIGSTSFTILSVLDDDGNTIPDGKYYFTVDSGSSNKEYFTGTLTGSTKTVASLKTVNRQGTETSGAVRSHRVGANIKITDFATYKNYMDEVALAGGSNATTSAAGFVQLGTSSQIDSDTATGSTGASLAVTPDQLVLSKYGTRLPTADEKSALAGTGTPSSSNKYVTADTLAASVKFGGTGSDGALVITSGTTTIDLAGSQTVTKNYTSISITGTGSLAFTNPHANGTTIILKSQGAITLTSSAAPMVDCSGVGAAGATNGFSFSLFRTNKGSNGSGTTPGSGGATPTFDSANAVKSIFSGKYSDVCPGAGGGNGSSNGQAPGGGGASFISEGSTSSGGTNSSGGTPGTGGRGGGVLIMECGGAWNFTTTNGISVKGSDGGNASGGSTAPGGGAGGSGVFICFYNTLTANTGTVNVSAATGGNGVVGGATGGSGAIGYSLIAQNTEYK